MDDASNTHGVGGHHHGESGESKGHACDSECEGHDDGCEGHGGGGYAHAGIGHSHGQNGPAHMSQAGPNENLLELGQRCLMTGDPARAAVLLREELSREGGASVDAHLLLAEALWQCSGGHGATDALPHYEAAASIAHEMGDTSKEGMVALGHGFALSKLGRAAAARSRLDHARKLAEADGNKQAAMFASNLLSQLGIAVETTTDDGDLMRTMWTQFAEAVAASKPAQLFLRGTMKAPLGDASAKGVSKLRAAGCQLIDYLDVEQPGDTVPEGLQAVSRSPHLEFPQLFVAGRHLPGWLDLAIEQLREKLEEAGLSLGDMPEAEACHGTAAFSDGLEPWEVALVELVSRVGSGDWVSKAKMLEEHLPAAMAAAPDASGSAPQPGSDSNAAAAALEVAWQRLAPIVREKLEKQPEMPCGHSCATCPTRHDCQLHDAVDGGGLKDIEDLG